MTLETQSATKWQRLEAIAAAARIDLPELKARIIDSDAQEAGLETARAPHRTTSATNTKDERNWDEVFSGCDLTTASGISVAHERFRAGDAPFYPEIFFRTAMERAPSGQGIRVCHSVWLCRRVQLVSPSWFFRGISATVEESPRHPGVACKHAERFLPPVLHGYQAEPLLRGCKNSSSRAIFPA